MKDRVPAEALPPGEFLKDELEQRGWTQEEFAAIIGRPTTLVNQIVLGKRAVTPEAAAEIGAALGVDAEYWMNLETAYRLWLVRQKQVAPALDRIAHMARLRSRFPVREMVKRGWIAKPDDPEVLEKQLLKFSGLKRVDDRSDLAHAAKKTYYHTELTPIQEAWLWRVKQIASSIAMKQTYKEQALRNCLTKLRGLIAEPEEIRHVPKILAEAGVRFLVVEALPGARIDGVCMWLNTKSPVIGMTLRYDRLDNFWFVLRHEIEHVLRKDGQGHPMGMVDIDLGPGAEKSSNALPKEEEAANIAAAEFCVPQEQFEGFLRRVQPIYSEERILGFSAGIGVHPALVVGQLQHRLNKFDIFRKYLTKVRHIITPSAITDGFGHVHPLTV
jgi:HTH-type transcriptional regulator/antitoxin HigA